jgi:hypothetical protein
MKSQYHFIAFILMVSLVLFSAQSVEANEMQRLFFQFSNSIGQAQANIEISGYAATVGNVNALINAGITQLTNIIEFPYQDPPFDVEQIERCRDKLMRFTQVTARWSDRHRAIYLKNVFSDFISAMSLIYDSRYGLQARGTCDTNVSYLGYHLARGYIAALNNDGVRVSSARSSVNLAVSEGIKVSQNLGCSFPLLDQWQSLGFQGVRTANDWLRILQEAEVIVNSTVGSAPSPYQTPSSSADGGGSSGFVGRWSLRHGPQAARTSHFSGAILEIKKCGNKFCGYLYELTDAQRHLGYQKVIKSTKSTPLVRRLG